jgi:hypothetical protein
MCQLFLEETADSEFIEVAEVSVMAFAAEGATSQPGGGAAS